MKRLKVNNDSQLSLFSGFDCLPWLPSERRLSGRIQLGLLRDVWQNMCNLPFHTMRALHMTSPIGSTHVLHRIDVVTNNEVTTMSIQTDEMGIVSSLGEEPAIYIEHTDINGTILYHSMWFKNGVLHRDNSAAFVIDVLYNKKCVNQMSIWCTKGVVHNDNGPAVISIHDNGCKSEYWVYLGRIHRLGDKPAIVFTDESGIVTQSEWYFADKLDRLNGPAVESILTRKGIHISMWYVGGVLHNANGPAKCTRDSKDQTNLNEYFLWGKKVPKKVFEQMTG